MRYLLTLILPLSLLVLQGCDQLQTPRDSLTGSGSSAAPAGSVETIFTSGRAMRIAR